MTTFLLIRHALHELGGETIAGRTPGVGLSPAGEAQASALALRLRELPVSAIYTSPMDRTRQTAGILGAALGLEPIVSEPLNELDFGDWQGRRLDELRPIEKWQHFNAFRSGTRAPAGELMIETQGRIVSFMTELRLSHLNETVALVSHGDVIRAALAYFLGVPLDLFQRIEVSPASVSVVAVADFGPWVLGVNHTGDLPMLPS